MRPLPSLNSPLKSVHHRSLGAAARDSGVGPIAPGPGALDQTVAVEHRVHRALGRDPDIAGQPPHQELADLPGAPVRLVALGRHDQPLQRLGQLVGMSRTGRRERSVRASSP